ncbi:MAG: sulfurtransferase complex subunit TusC [Kangiellaceae bacterium]|nr:sulfurtransferase complex subunit TusC [Kangiellaceae bacterium]
MKSICIIFNKVPYGSQSSRELLDIALMAAAFDMPIKALFIEQGVLQLINKQQPEVLDIKNHSATFKALELYGIEEIYVDANALNNYQLTHDDLMPIAELIDNNAISEHIQQSDFVLML